MSALHDMINRGMQVLEDLDPDAIRIGSIEYPGNFSEASTADIAGLGGYEAGAQAIFVVRKSVMATKPTTGERAIRNGRRWKIGEVTEDAVSFTILLENAK